MGRWPLEDQALSLGGGIYFCAFGSAFLKVSPHKQLRDSPSRGGSYPLFLLESPDLWVRLPVL